MRDFVDRKQEIKSLEAAWESERAELVVLYGRRRVGKTELLRQFTRERPCLFFSADLSTEKDQLRQFSERIGRHFQDPALQGESFTRWENLLEYLFARSRQERLLVVIDEFPYLCASNKALPSILQRLWDEQFAASRIKLVLCGSTLSFMEKEVLGHKSPLYGRRTAQLHLDPLALRDIAELFPGRTAEELVGFHGVVGGVPAYLVQLDPLASLEENIRRRILAKGTYLYEEVRFLLSEELREPNRYFSICKAVAHGKTKSQEIAEETGLESQLLSKYLGVLRDLRILRRDVPITEPDPAGSRRGVYRLQDPFFRFWFRYVFTYKSFLDQDQADLVWERFVAPTLQAFLEQPFREAVREWLQAANLGGGLPLMVERWGSWWLRESGLDLVGLDGGGRALAVATRWAGPPVGAGELAAFLDVVSGFAQHYELQQATAGWVSRPGLEPAAAALAAERGCRVWSLEELAGSPTR